MYKQSKYNKDVEVNYNSTVVQAKANLCNIKDEQHDINYDKDV